MKTKTGTQWAKPTLPKALAHLFVKVPTWPYWYPIRYFQSNHQKSALPKDTSELAGFSSHHPFNAER